MYFDHIYSLHPKSKIILHIKRKNKKSASLYFTDQLNMKINIPSDFMVLTNSKIQEPNETNDYTLFWSKNYDIIYNGETLYNIRNERTWTIYN